MACTADIYDKKSWFRDFSCSLYKACTAYTYVEKVGPETSPTACTAYIYDEKVVPKSSPPACTFPVQPTYVIKNLVQRLLLQPVHGLYSLYVWWWWW
jgi:hypothetical protein